MPVNLRVIDNKKYMWDGKEYENEGDALNVAAAYKKDKFDVQLIQEEGAPDVVGGLPIVPRSVAERGKYLIYTRRVAATAPTGS